jgi:phosphoribosyl 1,2-cyclic phosphodiesterase
VHFRDFPAVDCHETPCPPFEIGPFRIESALICHPDPTVGYRVMAGGRVLAYLPDHEPALCRCDGKWPDSAWISGYDLAEDADLLFHDAQYSDEEYAERVGFGHSSVRHAFEFAALTGVKELVPFHHDPSHDDAALDSLFKDAARRLKPRCKVSPGREGAVFELRARTSSKAIA